MTWGSVFQIIGGVGLFLYGIKLMSEALQYLAGDRMRQLIGSLTKTPIRGVFIGALVAMLIQSSSGTTVMTVSFVHAGLMTLKQAVGVIMGANIGTTVIAQIVAFKIKDFSLPILGIGVLLVLFGRTKRQKYIGNGLVGFGLLFLGMQTMEASMAFLRDRKDLFLAFSSSPLLGVFVGTAVTMVVQASSATIGLTMAMAAQGLLTLDAAIPILLGDNIGTTITAVIASMGANRSAKQAATAHVLFNVIGACIFLAALPLYKQVIVSTSGDISRQLANAHTIFNVANTILFLPFVSVLVWVIRHLVPDRGETSVAGPMYLDMKLIGASSAAAVDAVKKEILHMGSLAASMLRDVRRAFEENDPKMINEVTQTEKGVNEINRSITAYASEIWQKGLSSDLSTVLGSYVNGVGDIERIGDHATNLIELYEYKIDHGVEFSSLAMEEFRDMFDSVEDAVRLSLESLDEEDVAKAKEVDRLEDEVDRKEKTLRKNHITRLNRGECTPQGGVIFIDILSNLERVCDHAHNLSYIAVDISKLHR
ncbi:phosphate:Na+ symporter [Aminivibrio pyruvatiphilus]|uniref:Phosphate:Na+ symporter n=1 Tax=Aminivibrio pyruvatiphilus TaxID=1005740 RepID=A0A4R8MIN4_9BACT|nr:Na/Pi cotransporter family protein [Aminivibrio pyruvatiphilus]TDY64898.1 phosphate:Na+ symporter [Aminivibrio pyruvatiphilus]